MDIPTTNNIITEFYSDYSIPYIKENSKLLKLIDKFKDSYPDLFLIKDKIVLLLFIVGLSSLLVKSYIL